MQLLPLFYTERRGKSRLFVIHAQSLFPAAGGQDQKALADEGVDGAGCQVLQRQEMGAEQVPVHGELVHRVIAADAERSLLVWGVLRQKTVDGLPVGVILGLL